MWLNIKVGRVADSGQGHSNSPWPSFIGLSSLSSHQDYNRDDHWSALTSSKLPVGKTGQKNPKWVIYIGRGLLTSNAFPIFFFILFLMRSCRSYYDCDEKEEREKGRRGKKLGCVVKAKDKRTKEEEKWTTTVMTRLPSIVFMMTTMTTTMILMMTKKAKKEGEATVGKNNSQAGLLVTAHNFQQRFPASSSSLPILLIFFRKPFLTKVLHQVFIWLPQWKIGVEDRNSFYHLLKVI